MTKLVKSMQRLGLKFGGVNGILFAVSAPSRTGAQVWTLRRAVHLGENNILKSKSTSDGNMATGSPYEDSSNLGLEKSTQCFKEWEKYWDSVAKGTANKNILKDSPEMPGNVKNDTAKNERRWIMSMRHGERVDLTYGEWVPYCFDQKGNYIRKDLNLPLQLGEREGGAASYALDSPLTRVGRLQARLVGEGLRLAGERLTHVYASAALRSVETAHELLQGLEADPSVKIKVEPGLFEYTLWHKARGLSPFMTPQELHKAGYNVDTSYKPIVGVDKIREETVEEFYSRNESVIHSVVKATENEGGNVIFVGHAVTLDLMVYALNCYVNKDKEYPPYELKTDLLNKVSYCALLSVRTNPWKLLPPPCPPSINSSSGRFDWKLVEEYWDEQK